MGPWDLLDDRSESELHKTRLLNVEEKPFKRITKRLVSISSALSGAGGGGGGPSSSLQEDLTLDFAAFDSSVARFQFLHEANARERERYAADQQRIVAECEAVRANNARLREQLESARATLAQRNKFDVLAERITSNRLLRPRDDQRANLAKLEDECRELERESETYSETWRERRDQFNRIMEEGMLLRRQIRDEKEEVDRREGMEDGGGDDDGDGDKDGPTPRNLASEQATPLPDGDSQPRAADAAESSESRAATPSQAASAPDRPRPRSGLSRDVTHGDVDMDEVEEGEDREEGEESGAREGMEVDG